jgi:hypothetical protein
VKTVNLIIVCVTVSVCVGIITEGALESVKYKAPEHVSNYYAAPNPATELHVTVITNCAPNTLSTK